MSEEFDDETLREVLLACQASRQAVCLVGSPGCGKSRLINLAWSQRYPNSSLVDSGPVSFNVDSSIDAKSLVGTFRSSLTEAGRFEWADGLLVELIRKGRWLVLEDVDRVSADTLSILPRQDDTYFSIPETGEQVPIHADFALVGTSTNQNFGKLRSVVPSWILLRSSAPADLSSIINHLLPPSVTTLLLSSYQAILSTTSASFERKFGLHDLFRVVERVSKSLDFLSIHSSTDFLTEFQKAHIGRELVDVFVFHSPFPDRKEELISAIQNSLEIDRNGLIDPCPSFSSDSHTLTVGATKLKRLHSTPPSTSSGFTLTSVHLQTLRSVVRSVLLGEKTLIVGDTGVGKTTTVQFLAKELGVDLFVYNFSDQTEGSDLIGGLKPVMDLDKLVARCEQLLTLSLGGASKGSNTAVMEYIRKRAERRDATAVIKAVEKTASKAIVLLTQSEGVEEVEQYVSEWKEVVVSCRGAGKMFRFVEGPLVTAVRNGSWILLDELNLAPPDVLRQLNSLLETGTLAIAETGEIVKAAESFRLFAAMNPPHLGRGKRALPDSVRSRFLEIFVPEITQRSDLVQLVHEGMQRDLTASVLAVVVPRIVDLYLSLKSVGHLSTVENTAPVFSLRTLTRGLEFAKRLLRSPKRSAGAAGGDGTRELVDALKVSLTSALDSRSEKIVIAMIEQTLPTTPVNVRKSTPNAPTHAPSVVDSGGWIEVGGQWIATGDFHEDRERKMEKFVISESVGRNLRKLSVCLAGGRLARPPVLCEGTTGAGKTSLVTYLAAVTSHRLVRINNHEHTDLQDYLGQYVGEGSSGGLTFREGPLVAAVRRGDWVLLDELNLAPTEVLEALNRLLDDNRELVIPETGECVKAHPDFVLFATQNPVSTSYAGRKQLSRALRNRFVEIQIDELPPDELAHVLAQKCALPPSVATRMLATYTELSRLRRLDRVLSGKDSALVTVRDLLRWGNRKPFVKEDIAVEGYLVLVERLRTKEQRDIVVKVLEEKVGVKDLPRLVSEFYKVRADSVFGAAAAGANTLGATSRLVRTSALERVVALVARAVEAGESVLLVGETGTGKTSAVQFLSDIVSGGLRIVNCHQHMETSDLLGAVGPTAGTPGLLRWKDGPLVDAVRDGTWFLLDEVNLADDSVVERLNSLLDVDYRAVVLAEKPGGEELVVAAPTFRLLSTMNPGNDFGKKELSSALRNRFTEIWTDPICFSPAPTGEGGEMTSTGQLMIDSLLKSGGVDDERVGETICRVMAAAGSSATTRDAVEVVKFVSKAKEWMSTELALAHAVAALLLDSSTAVEKDRVMAALTCSGLVTEGMAEFVSTPTWITFSEQEGSSSSSVGGFPVPSGVKSTGTFTLNAPTSRFNFGRLVRAVTTGRPVLLHGDPGAGKSSVVAAVAQFHSRPLVRINLSDQTELADILGQSVPVEGGRFEWRDGILLQAIARGDWVLLDELNLAPQPVLEGLNALFDHRAEVYVPAIDRTVKCSSEFRLFATQNEASKGDGRKMLPKSLVSRFTRIRVETLSIDDLLVVATDGESGDDKRELVEKTVKVMRELGRMCGAGFEWNLRDLNRVLECHKVAGQSAGRVVWQILASRISDKLVRSRAMSIVGEIFALPPSQLDWIDPSTALTATSITSTSANTPTVDLLYHQSQAVGSVHTALAGSCHVIITGDSGVGKRSVIRLLSSAEKILVEIRMHSQMDTSDLIGQFQQRPDGRFEWSDSALTTAVRSGGTIVLANADTCPPAILDRLNALIEVGGVLVIPEKGTADLVVPHPSFRLVLMTNKVSLLSRAIRNRCVEVHLPTSAGDAASTGLSSLVDKVRVGMNVDGGLERGVIVDIAKKVKNVREMKQAALLAVAGLDVSVATTAVTGADVGMDQAGSCDDGEIEEVYSGIKSGLNVVERQSAIVEMFRSSDRFAYAVSWFVESGVNWKNMSDRWAMVIGHPFPTSTTFNSVVPDDILVRRLIVQLLVNQPTTVSEQLTRSSIDTATLHGLVRGVSRSPVGAKNVAEEITCYDHLLSIESPTYPLEILGAYRESSEDLIAALRQLSELPLVPTSVIAQLAKAAISLRSSNTVVAAENELKILRTVQEMIEKYTPAEVGEDEVEEEIEVAPHRGWVDTVLRILGVVDIALLVKCESVLTEHDILLSGLSEESVEELFFATESNRLSLSSRSLVNALHAMIECASTVRCDDTGSLVTSFKVIDDVLTRQPLESSTPFGLSVESVMVEIHQCVSGMSEIDFHSVKADAVTDLTHELQELETEIGVKSVCVAVASVGIDSTSAKVWAAHVQRTMLKLVESGIYCRGSSAVYAKLRQLMETLSAQLGDIVQGGKVQVLVGFVKTISQDEFRFFRDITRPISWLLLKLIVALIHQASTTAMERNGMDGTALSPIIPVWPETSLPLSTFVEWNMISEKLSPILPHTSRAAVRDRLHGVVAEATAPKPEPTEDDDQVVVSGEKIVTLESLVEDNDKARADAAVLKLRRELFPAAKSVLKVSSGDPFEDEEDERVVGESGVGVVKMDEMDKVAIALVTNDTAGERLSLSTFFVDQVKARFSSPCGEAEVDTPEMVGLNHVRLRSVIEEKLVGVVAVGKGEKVLDPDMSVGDSVREIKLKLGEYLKSGGRVVSFYSSGGGRDALQLVTPVLKRAHLQLRALENIQEISDHPDVVETVVIVKKALSLTNEASALSVLQAAEVVLAQFLRLDQSIPSRYLKPSNFGGDSDNGGKVVHQLTSVVATLRASEVASWKDLRVTRESILASQGSGKWLTHLWSSTLPAADAVVEDESSKSLFEITCEWLGTCGYVQFEFRLALLRVVAELTSSRALRHAVSVGEGWRALAHAKMVSSRAELNKSVKALMKEIQFRLGGRHYSAQMFRMDTKRSHNQIAAAMKRFEESVSEPIGSAALAGATYRTPNEGKMKEDEKVKEEGMSVAEVLHDCMSTIKNAAGDKSAKSLKQRLLADATEEVRTTLAGATVNGVLPLTKAWVMSAVVESVDPVPGSAEIVGKSLKLSVQNAVCRNNDVRPQTLLTWRGLCVVAIQNWLDNVLQEQQEKVEEEQRRWMGNADSCVADVELVKRGLEFVDKAILVAQQFELLPQAKEVLSERLVAMVTKVVPKSVTEQLASTTMTPNTLFVKGKFVNEELPSLISLVATSVYANDRLTALFSQSSQQLIRARLEAQDLITQLKAIVLHPLTSSPPTTLTQSSPTSLSVSDVISIIDFTRFLHDEGLCTKPEQSEESNGEGKVEWNDGTGLGDGDGVNDKSDEIEDAAQFDLDRDEKQQGDDGEDEEREEEDGSKGIDANADQGMNEDDVTEHNQKEKEKGEDEEEEKDGEEDREMGDVDMNDGGQIDETGAPPEDGDGEDEEVGEDEIELKNGEKGEKDEEETRAADDKGKKKEGSEEQSEQAEEGEGEQEDGGEEEEDGEGEGKEDEKFEAFVDPSKQPEDDEGESVDGEDDDVNMDEGDGEEDGEEGGGEEDATEETDPNNVDEEVGSEVAGEDEQVEGKRDDDMRDDDEEEDNVMESSAGLDTAPSAAEESAVNDNYKSQGQEEQSKKSSAENQGKQDSNSAQQDGAGVETARTSKSRDGEKSSAVRPPPSPTDPNGAEAMDEWLKEIKEIVEKAVGAPAGEETGEKDIGDVGEKDEESSKRAIGAATEAIAGDLSVPEDDGGEDDNGVDEKKADGDREEEDKREVVRRGDDVVMSHPEVEEGEDKEVDGSEVEEIAESQAVGAKKLFDQQTTEEPSVVDPAIVAATAPVEEEMSEVGVTPVEQVMEEKKMTGGEDKAEDVLEVSSGVVMAEARAARLSADLSEKLLAVLEPTRRGRLEGFFKTGKRVSMRRVLSWIASDYKRDKFWLRRTRPSHRDYRVVVCVDNTLSMQHNGVGETALICVAAIAQSLTLLEVGKIGVMSFGTEVREIAPLTETSGATSSSGSVADLMTTFRFDEESTSSFSNAFPSVIHKCSEAFQHSEESSGSASGGSLALILTDGRFDKDKCRPYVQELVAQGHIPVLIVIDANKEESILSVTSVVFEEEPVTKKRKIVRKPFLSQTDCPFSFYAVIQDPSQLPLTLADVLRQWIEMTS